MILTGREIEQARLRGEIEIEPFDAKLLNPNSYNYRLGNTLIVPDTAGNTLREEPVAIPADGYVLAAHTLYLGATMEVLGSKTYAMSLIGRSSIGRLGLFLQVSANLGHQGSSHAWTLELVAARPIRLYPQMRIGQVSFWEARGSCSPYKEGYSRYSEPTRSKWLRDVTAEAPQ